MIGSLPPVQTPIYHAPHANAGAHSVAEDRAGKPSSPSSTADQPDKSPPPSSAIDNQTLSEEEKAKVEELKSVDREIRAHEQAHKNAGGQYAGSASFEFKTGPDGKRYAVSGEVPIDAAPVEGDPEATIEKMDQIISAALAPAEPSAQDRKVAAQARAAKNKAQAELTSQKAEGTQAANGQPGAGSQEAASQPVPGVSAYQTAGALAVSGSSPEVSFAV